MSFSSGVFTLVAGNPVVTGTTVSSTWANNTLADIATGLSTCILKDGTQTATATVPFTNITASGTLAVTGTSTLGTVNAGALASSVANAGGLTQEALTNPSLGNGWTNQGAPYAVASYWKDSEGVVHIDGILSSGTLTTGTIIFTLASGYRPSGQIIFPVSGNGGYAEMQAKADGTFSIRTSNGAGIYSLAALNFRP